jgi:hypothetical protein
MPTGQWHRWCLADSHAHILDVQLRRLPLLPPFTFISSRHRPPRTRLGPGVSRSQIRSMTSFPLLSLPNQTVRRSHGEPVPWPAGLLQLLPLLVPRLPLQALAGLLLLLLPRHRSHPDHLCCLHLPRTLLLRPSSTSPPRLQRLALVLPRERMARRRRSPFQAPSFRPDSLLGSPHLDSV